MSDAAETTTGDEATATLGGPPKPGGEAAGLTRFEVRDGIRRVPCTLSDEALSAFAGLAPGVPTALRRRAFDRFRSQIDAAARLKLGGLPPGFAGPLAVDSDDLRRAPREPGVATWIGRLSA